PVLPLEVPSQPPDVSRWRLFPRDSALRSEDLHHTRGVAASGFRPLRKIPHCCLPYESGPCLSSSVSYHTLRPVYRRRLDCLLSHHSYTSQPTLHICSYYFY